MPDHHATLPLWPDQSLEQKIETLHDLVLDLYGYVTHAATEDLLRVLAAHPCRDDHERESVALIARLLRETPQVWSPDCPIGHITGSALVVDPAGRRVLLMHHRKLDRWLQLGGHGEHELQPWAIALREATEESGLIDLQFHPPAKPPLPFDIDAHVIPARPTAPQHYHLDIRYLMTTAHPELITHREAEAHGLRWFTFAECRALGIGTDESVMRLVRKAEEMV